MAAAAAYPAQIKRGSPPTPLGMLAEFSFAGAHASTVTLTCPALFFALSLGFEGFGIGAGDEVFEPGEHYFVDSSC